MFQSSSLKKIWGEIFFDCKVEGKLVGSGGDDFWGKLERGKSLEISGNQIWEGNCSAFFTSDSTILLFLRRSPALIGEKLRKNFHTPNHLIGVEDQ